MVNIPKKVLERLGKEIGKFQKVLKAAKDRDVNESDTVTIVTDMLVNVFGFDKYTEITSEQVIRGTYCDLAVNIDGKIKYLIEVKAIGLNLKENHLRQAISYGANHGLNWVILTNGVDWEVYKIKFEKPLACDLVCTFDFTMINPKKQEDQDKVFLLCKEGVAKSAIEEFHVHIQSVNKFVIGAIALSEPVNSLIRRELRKVAPMTKVTEDEIERIMSSEVLKRDVVEGEPAEEAKRRVKKVLKKHARKHISKKKTKQNPEKSPMQEQGLPATQLPSNSIVED